MHDLVLVLVSASMVILPVMLYKLYRLNDTVNTLSDFIIGSSRRTEEERKILFTCILDIDNTLKAILKKHGE